VELSEYLMAMLQQLGYVDEKVVERFTKEFRDLDIDGSGKLDKHDLDLLNSKLKTGKTTTGKAQGGAAQLEEAKESPQAAANDQSEAKEEFSP
jgi:hypothetical protein